MLILNCVLYVEYPVASTVESAVHGVDQTMNVQSTRHTAYIHIVQGWTWWKLCVISMPILLKNVGCMTMSLIFCPTRKSRSTVCICFSCIKALKLLFNPVSNQKKKKKKDIARDFTLFLPLCFFVWQQQE